MRNALFLPFTRAGKATELRALEVKRVLGLLPDAAVDPYAVLPDVPGRLLSPAVLEECCAETRQVLLIDERDDWSAICYGKVGADGEALILVNPTHHANRQRVSVMEEIVHVVLDHPKTELRLGVDARIRPYDAAVEDEAYGVGAACIIPYPVLFDLVHKQHRSVAEIAMVYGVSISYVEYRIKRAGLYRVLRKYRQRAGTPSP